MLSQTTLHTCCLWFQFPGNNISVTGVDHRTTSSACCAEKTLRAPCIVNIRHCVWLLPLPTLLHLTDTGSPTGNRRHQTCLIFTIPHQGGCESFEEGGAVILSHWRRTCVFGQTDVYSGWETFSNFKYEQISTASLLCQRVFAGVSTMQHGCAATAAPVLALRYKSEPGCCNQPAKAPLEE